MVATRHTGSPADGRRGLVAELDVRDGDAVRQAVERVRPAAVIHTAYRQDGDGARETTVDGAEAVAAAAREAGARLVHMSSDVIFDGRKPAPYDEATPLPDHRLRPGQGRRRAARGRGSPGAVLVRTSLIYGGDGESRHEQLALQAAGGDGQLGFFDDELRCPVLVADLAAALLELVDLPERGVLNVAGSEVVTRYEFACLVAARRRARRGGDPPHLIAEAGLERPRNCALDTGRAPGAAANPLRGARERLGAPPADRPAPPTAEVARMGAMEDWVIWLTAAGVLAVGETLTLSFFLGPVAVAALVAAEWPSPGARWRSSWVVFILVAASSVALLRPVARRHLHTPAQLRTGVAALVGSARAW